ncbi:MAG: type II toxin-antitoxin system Phd/YefM family antitoxin [Paracoccaceae bacterium]
MPLTLTSRQFNQDTARAKREAAKGPVFVTDRGRTTHVLLTVEEFERMKGPKKTLADMLYWPGAAEVELELPERRIEPVREIDWGFDR